MFGAFSAAWTSIALPLSGPGAQAVDSVRACVEIGASTSDDACGTATAVWVALHGYATLHSSRPAFPWPPTDATLDHIVTALASLDYLSSNEDARR
jgi:hypothetical protein